MKLALGVLSFALGAEARKLLGHSDLRFTDASEYLLEYFMQMNDYDYSATEDYTVNAKEFAWLLSSLTQRDNGFYDTDYLDDDEKMDYAVWTVNAFDKDGDDRLDSDEWRKLKAFYIDPRDLICTKQYIYAFADDYPDDDGGISDTSMRVSFITDQIPKTKGYDKKIKNWCHQGLEDYQEYWPVVTLSTWMNDLAEFVSTDGTVDGMVTYKTFRKAFKAMGGTWKGSASGDPDGWGTDNTGNYYGSMIPGMHGLDLDRSFERYCGINPSSTDAIPFKPDFMDCYMEMIGSEAGMSWDFARDNMKAVAWRVTNLGGVEAAMAAGR